MVLVKSTTQKEFWKRGNSKFLKKLKTNIILYINCISIKKKKFKILECRVWLRFCARHKSVCPRQVRARATSLSWEAWVLSQVSSRWWTAPFASMTCYKVSQPSQSCNVFSLLRENLCLCPPSPSPRKGTHLPDLDVKLHHLWKVNSKGRCSGYLSLIW